MVGRFGRWEHGLLNRLLDDGVDRFMEDDLLESQLVGAILRIGWNIYFYWKG